MGCVICENKTKSFIQINSTPDWSGLEISINSEGLLRVRTYTTLKDSSFSNQDFINLSYCPCCGKKFKEEL